MPKAWSIISHRHEDGFSVVEVLLAAVVFGMLVTGMIGAIIYGRAATADSGDHRRAVYIAQEGLDAVRNINNAAFANLTDGTFGLVQSAGTWTLSGASDTSNGFTRQITIATAATNRKTITSTVTWPQMGGGTGNVVLSARLSNWESNIKLWTNAVISGSNDATGTNDAIKVDTVGNYAYVVKNATTNNLVIVNISNPAAPSIVSTTTIAGTPTNITVSGNYAYVTNQSDTAELQVIDISNPAAPVLKASVNMTGTGNGQSVAVSGTFAYVARASDATAGANEVTSVNISNPLVPAVTGGYNNNIAMNGIYISGNFAYVATSSTTTEMLVINISNPASLTLAGSYNAPTSVAAQTVSGYGTTAFLGVGTGMNAVNIATPATPTNISTFTSTGTINKIDIDITQKYAFLGTSGTAGEFQVVNVGTPATMTLAKTVDITGTTSTIAGLAYNMQYDIVVAASASNTQEVLVFTRN